MVCKAANYTETLSRVGPDPVGPTPAGANPLRATTWDGLSRELSRIRQHDPGRVRVERGRSRPAGADSVSVHLAGIATVNCTEKFTEVTEPYVEIYRRLSHRAIDRGEVSATLTASIPVLAEVIPAMSTHHLDNSHGPVDRDFYVSVVDDVVRRALR